MQFQKVILQENQNNYLARPGQQQQMDFGSLTHADRNYVLFCIIITLLQSIVMHITIKAELHRNRSPPSTLTRAHLFIQAQIDHMLSTIYCRCFLKQDES